MKIYCLFLLVVLTQLGFQTPGRAQTKIFDDSTTSVTEIGTNSKYSDFGPFVIHDSLYFTSYNENNGKTGRKEFYDLFVSEIDKKGDEKSQRQVLKEFFTRYNDGPVAWCEKTGELFVTQNYIDQSVAKKPFEEEIVRLKIIIAERINGKWQKTGEFPFHDHGYSVAHPALTESGDTIFFSSDMPGGYGETDLYYSVRKEGQWSNPVNMGPQINTPGKEGFAFLTDRNFGGRYLIFSSQRVNSIGGLDLYYTKFPSTAIEIGHFNKPINTVYDDFALTIPTGADFGYLTSNRPGTGDDDIYKFTFKRIKPEVAPKFREIYVYDRKSGKPIPGVKIISSDKNTYKADKGGRISAVVSTDKESDIMISAAGYKDKSGKLVAFNSGTNGSLKDTIWMDPQKKTGLKLNNIYYDLDKWDILPESAEELNKLTDILNENPDFKVQFKSFTDDRGSVEYNLRLSWMRTKAAMDYIVSKGIDRLRISGENYGEMQLINECPQPCPPEKYRENRRTEIVIPGILNGEPLKQLKGDYSSDPKDQTRNKNSRHTNRSFLLVLNSFHDQSKASGFFRKMENEGNKMVMTKDSTNIKVGISFDSFRKAKEILEYYKDKYRDAWIKPIK